MRRLLRVLRTLRRDQRGTATTELAIVGVLMIPVTMYAAFFYDVLQIKLKVQEAARFAVFEFANWPLHDYDKGKDGHKTKQRDAKKKIEEGVAKMYKDLNSASTDDASPRLTVTHTEPRFRLSVKKAPLLVDFPQGIPLPRSLELFRGLMSMAAGWLEDQITPTGYASMVGGIMQAPPPGGREAQWVGAASPPFAKGIGSILDQWGFNDKARAEARVNITIKNDLIPRRFGSGWLRKTIVGRRVPTIRFQQTYAIIADSWKLHDGREIHITGSAQQDKTKPFYKTVNRINETIVGSKGNPLLQSGYRFAQTAGRVAGMTGDPTETKLVSLDYGKGSGRRTVRLDQGNHQRHTAAMDVGDEYHDTLDARGQHYMGCDKAQERGCWSDDEQGH